MSEERARSVKKYIAICTATSILLLVVGYMVHGWLLICASFLLLGIALGMDIAKNTPMDK